MPNPLSLVTRQWKKPLTGVAGPGMHWAGPSGGGVGGERPSEQEKKKAAAMSFRHRRRARGQGGGEARPAPPTPPSLSLTHRVERGRARPDGADRQGGSEQDLGEHRGRAREPGGKKKKRVRRGGWRARAAPRRRGSAALALTLSSRPVHHTPKVSSLHAHAAGRPASPCRPLLSLVASSPSGIEERERGARAGRRDTEPRMRWGGGAGGRATPPAVWFFQGGGEARPVPPPARCGFRAHSHPPGVRVPAEERLGGGLRPPTPALPPPPSSRRPPPLPLSLGS